MCQRFTCFSFFGFLFFFSSDFLNASHLNCFDERKAFNSFDQTESDEKQREKGNRMVVLPRIINGLFNIIIYKYWKKKKIIGTRSPWKQNFSKFLIKIWINAVYQHDHFGCHFGRLADCLSTISFWIIFAFQLMRNRRWNAFSGLLITDHHLSRWKIKRIIDMRMTDIWPLIRGKSVIDRERRWKLFACTCKIPNKWRSTNNKLAMQIVIISFAASNFICNDKYSIFVIFRIHLCSFTHFCSLSIPK